MLLDETKKKFSRASSRALGWTKPASQPASPGRVKGGVRVERGGPLRGGDTEENGVFTVQMLWLPGPQNLPQHRGARAHTGVWERES